MSDILSLSSFSPVEVRQMIQACDLFETAWVTGLQPPPEHYLSAAAEPVRSALLRQLLLLDWDYRRRAGDDPSAGDYVARFPGDTAVVEDVGREMAETSVSTLVEADQPSSGVISMRGRGHGALTAFADDATTRYDLGQEVGHGGIGVVYRGRDRVLGRELAIKVLREVHLDKPEARRRFAAEARIGSQLQHPAIVPVYEQGQFADGRPYFTMKLVEGRTLAALLRYRTNPGQDLQRLLGVFEQVCQAVAYAHAQHVVHRDLKPANVMVGAFGEVQVMDWGFAKVLGSDRDGDSGVCSSKAETNGLSQSGTMMGTPAYVPPEQARGEVTGIDSRADVFALGAILCEILTGRPPYSRTPSDDVCRQVAEGDLADAHARLDACGADSPLRDLAKRCLNADRSARPADAGAVAREMTTLLASAQERLRQAQLDQAAAEARAQEATAKAKAERRAWWWTLSAAAALLIGAGVAVWQAIVANQATQNALAAADAQQIAKETADAKEAETRSILGFVQDRILAAARPEGQDGGLGQDVSLRKALKAALPFVDKSFVNQPLTEARLRMTLGISFFDLGEAQYAADQAQKARALYAKHRGDDHPDTLASMNAMAISYSVLGRHADACKLHEEVLAIQKAKLGPDHPDTLASMNNLAASYNSLGRYAEALALGAETLALRKAKLGPDHPDTIASMSNLAGSYNSLGRYADALTLGAEALALRKARLGPNHPDTLDSMDNLAFTHAALGRYADAVKLAEETLARRKVKQGPYHPDTLKTMVNVANGYSALGRHADALTLREETLALQKARLPPNHPDTLWTMHNLANSYAKLGRRAEALKLREETLTLRETKLGPNHPDTLRSLKALAESLIQLNRGAEAVPVIDNCVRRSNGRVVHPKLIPDVMDMRLRYFEKAKDASGCRATAEMWEKLQRTDTASLYQAVVCRAVTAKVLRATVPSSETVREADAEADQAMAWLKRAVAAGYKDVANMNKDADLDVLRDRADFRAILEAMGAGG